MSMELVKYEAMHQAIVEAHSVDEVKDIRDRAEALRLYAKQSKQGIEDINRVTEIKLRAERRAGEMLRELPTGSGGDRRSEKFQNPQAGEVEIVQPQTKGEAIADAGVSKSSADRWQQIADIPDLEFEELLTETKEAKEELTTSKVLRKSAEIKRQEMINEKQEAPPISGKYRVWYADPPWSYGNSGVITESDNYGRAERHYPSMSIKDLCEMGIVIKNASEENAVLFMWVTSPLLAECFEVITAWGFKYKSSFVWDKIGHNFAHYNSMRHEFLLVCTRGSCTPDSKKLIDSVQSIEKSRKHSEKPEAFREIIEQMYTHGERIELFARTEADGWNMWGNEK